MESGRTLDARCSGRELAKIAPGAGPGRGKKLPVTGNFYCKTFGKRADSRKLSDPAGTLFEIARERVAL